VIAGGTNTANASHQFQITIRVETHPLTGKAGIAIGGPEEIV
jgi:hypothetical protein